VGWVWVWVRVGTQARKHVSNAIQPPSPHPPIHQVVIFTASLAKYADPLLDQLDIHNVARARLFREACVHHEGSFVKDLSLLGRDPTDVIIVDNSPMSYLFQPENALPCESFIDDPADRELWALADFLEAIYRVADVRDALQRWTSGAASQETGRGRGGGVQCMCTLHTRVCLQACSMAWRACSRS
jgi:Dullard-like phosphatase family protein